MTDDLTLQAFDQARQLDHGWVGPEHLLLALLAMPSLATDVLAGLGVTYDRVAEYLRDRQPDPDWPKPRYEAKQGLTGPNPAGHQLIGSARGFALAEGHDSPGPEHWLLAMVYSGPGHTVDWVLDDFGTSQRAVHEALRRHGVQVPDVDPPMYRPPRFSRQIEVSETELESILGLLLEQYPPGSERRWGFKWLPGEPVRARILSEEGIDLDDVLAEARRVANS